MGWLFYHTHRTPKEECDSKFPIEHYTILKSAMVGSTYYAAVHIHKENRVVGFIFMTSRNKGEFGYKDMDESMGPYQHDCPVGILDLLSDPAPNDHAATWRQKCRENAAKKRALPKIKIGQTIELISPLKFKDGTTQSRFKIEGQLSRRKQRKVFRSLSNGFLYSIPRLTRRYPFRIVA